jgi:hypothetical protein
MSDGDDSGSYVAAKVECEGLEVGPIPTNKASRQGQWHKRFASKESDRSWELDLEYHSTAVGGERVL